MSWVTLALLGTFFWGMSNIVDKILRTNYLKSSLALTSSFGIPRIVMCSILFLFVGFNTPPFSILILAILAGISSVLVNLFYIKSLSLEEASRVVPLWHLSPILILVLAVIFLGEVLTPIKYLAFSVILVGGFLISTKRIEKVFTLSPALLFMFLSSLFVSFNEVILKFLYNPANFWTIFLVFYTTLAVGEFSLLTLPKVRKDIMKSVHAHGYKTFSFVALAVFIGFFGFITYNQAILLGPITLVSVFIAFQSLFVLIIATILSLKFPLFIKEAVDFKTIGTKLVAIALMALGLYLLAV